MLLTCLVINQSDCIVFRNSIAFLLAGCQDGSVSLWNVNQGNLVHKFNTSDGVTCLDTMSHKWQAICGTQSGSVYRFVVVCSFVIC